MLFLVERSCPVSYLYENGLLYQWLKGFDGNIKYWKIMESKCQKMLEIKNGIMLTIANLKSEQGLQKFTKWVVL